MVSRAVTLVRGGPGPSPLKDALAELQEERDRSKALEAEMQREGLKKDEEMKREMDKSDAQRKALEEELAKCKDKCKALEQKMNSEMLQRDEAMKSEVQKRDSQCKGLEEELARLRAVEQKLRQELQVSCPCCPFKPKSFISPLVGSNQRYAAVEGQDKDALEQKLSLIQ